MNNKTKQSSEHPAQQEPFDHVAAANSALNQAQNRSYQIASAAQQEPKFVRNFDGIPCITLAEHEHLMRSRPQAREPLSNREIYTAYITATNQTLRAQDERIVFSFARAIEAAHGIKENT